VTGPTGDILDTAEAGPAAIRGSAIRIGGYGAGVLLTVVSTALLFRHLGVRDSGRYVTVLTLVAITQGLTESGLTALGMRELSTRTGDDRRRLMGSLLGLRIVLTIGGVAAAVAFAAVAGYGSTLVVGTAVVGAALVVQNVQTTMSIALMSRLSMGLVATAEFVRQAVLVAAIIVLVVAGAGLAAFFFASLLSATIALAFTWPFVRHEVPGRPRWDVAAWRGLLGETLSFAVATAVNVLYFRVAVILMSLIATAQQSGYFNASFRIVEVLTIVPGLAINAVFPIFARAARDDRARLAYAVQRTFEGGVVLGALIALALSVGAPLAIRIVGGPEFAPAASVLRIQAIALAASFAVGTWGFALLSLRRHRELVIVNTASLVFAAGLVAVLAATHGAEGAAVATLCGEVGMAVGSAVLLTRAHPELRPRLAVLIPIALAASAGGALALVRGVPNAVQIAVAVLVYSGVLLALRAVPAEITIEARKLVGRLRRA
jgi:O-antigen/teichoic acid export membrane protein